MNPENKRQLTEMLLSWARVFTAASLSIWYASGVFDFDAMWKAGIMALLPVAIRYFDAADKVYGRGANE